MDKLEWLNSQEERCDMMLKENARRKKFFEGEMSAIHELKKLVQGNEKINEENLQNQISSFEQILAEVPQEIKTLEVDAEKKIFKLNGIDFADSCDYFGVSCTATEGFRIRMELSKRIICANYGIDNTLKEPVTLLMKSGDDKKDKDQKGEE